MTKEESDKIMVQAFRSECKFCAEKLHEFAKMLEDNPTDNVIEVLDGISSRYSCLKEKLIKMQEKVIRNTLIEILRNG